MSKIKVLALSGSTRKASSNLNLIKAIAELSKGDFEVKIFEGIDQIPHFNPDIDDDKAGEKVTEFKTALRESDAVLISTPEYAVGVPGTLKNAIDWTVSSMELSHKPMALITASTLGTISHQSLLGTLLIIESRITEQTQLVISSIKTKLNNECVITDTKTLEKLQSLIASLKLIVLDPDAQEYLPPPKFSLE